MGIIDKVIKKIKPLMATSWFDDVLWLLIIVMVSLTSFSLGMQHERNRYLDTHPIYLHDNEDAAMVWERFHEEKKAESYFFASKSGSVYYSRDCTAGERVKAENRIYFRTKQEVEDLDYRFSGQC